MSSSFAICGGNTLQVISNKHIYTAHHTSFCMFVLYLVITSNNFYGIPSFLASISLLPHQRLFKTTTKTEEFYCLKAGLRNSISTYEDEIWPQSFFRGQASFVKQFASAISSHGQFTLF